jgi:hypothetical protein
MEMKIIDGFVWFIVTDKAKELFHTGLFELFAVYPDGSEGLLDNYELLSAALEKGLEVGIEGGYINN